MKIEKDQFDDRGLTQLLKAFKTSNLPEGKLGILGDGNARSGGESTNAEIGAKHELGLEGLPMRSFLRVPIIDLLESRLKESGAFKEQAMKRVLKEGSLKPWMEKVMIISESIVSDGFSSGGFGKWKPSNMTNKTNHQTLVETQQLRNSITSEVK